MKYYQLCQKKGLEPYEKKIKHSLLADISVKLGSASAGLSTLIGPSAVKSAL